jgi:hypothetical protein
MARWAIDEIYIWWTYPLATSNCAYHGHLQSSDLKLFDPTPIK